MSLPSVFLVLPASICRTGEYLYVGSVSVKPAHEKPQACLRVP